MRSAIIHSAAAEWGRVSRALGRGLLLAIVLSGCATRWDPPSEPLREHLGAVAVVSTSAGLGAPSGPEVIGAGAGAKSGFAQGSLGTLKGALAVFAGSAQADGFGALLGVAIASGLVVLSPVVGVAGSVVGAARAGSPEEVDAAAAELESFVTSEMPDKELAEEILAAAMKSVPGRLIEVIGDVPDVPESDMGEVRFPYENLSYRSVLRISASYSFEVEGRISPDVKLTAYVHAALVPVDSAFPVYEREWQYVGQAQNYFALGADGAALLRQQFRAGYALIAEKIVHDLFVADKPEGDGSSVVKTLRVSW